MELKLKLKYDNYMKNKDPNTKYVNKKAEKIIL